MNRSPSRILILISISSALLSLSASGADGSEKRSFQGPNIILCMADDLGWGDLGYNGNSIIKTPHLDQMAKEGVQFNRFYSAAPVCSPTRASCLTGRHPYRTGIFFANVGILRPEEITIAEILKTQGYTTGHFGKWHLGTFSQTEADANRGGKKHPELFNPPSLHGFDTYFSTESKVPTWDPMVMPEKFTAPESKRYGWNALSKNQSSVPYGTHYWTPQGKATENLKGDDSRVLMDRAISFIKKSTAEKKPFLAVIWFHAPHLPCVAGPKYAAMYKDQGFKMQQYAGCITALDDQMGRLRDTLKKLNINDNTLLFFTSDNGPEHGTPGSSGGFKDRKRSLHEGGIRVPGLMTWPNGIKKNFSTDTPCVTSDYLPTIVEALHIDLPKNKLDGTSFLPLIQGKKLKRATPIAFISKNQKSYNDTQFKFYKIGRDIKLYDILKDPKEKKNIAAQHPEVLKKFTSDFDQWLSTCKDSFEGKEYGTKSLKKVRQHWPHKKKK